jgi:hypothetical protein
MTSVLSGIRKELVIISRNGISLYMALAPALLALVFLMVFGTLQNSTQGFVIMEEIPQEIQMKLEQVADLERLKTEEEVIQRVEGPDAIAGLIWQDGSLRILVEGNEGESFALAVQALVGKAVAAEVPSFSSETVVGQGSWVYRLTRMSMFLLALFVGGATLGLSVVDERESRVMQALTVSPVGLLKYMLLKWMPAMLIGLVGVASSAMVIGAWQELPNLMLLSLFGLGVCGFSVFVIPAFAGNQLAAIGVMKLLMPLMLMVPITAFFVAEKWQFFYYPVPMYWQAKALETIFNGGNAWGLMTLSLLVGIPWALAAAGLFSKRTLWKGWR